MNMTLFGHSNEPNPTDLAAAIRMLKSQPELAILRFEEMAHAGSTAGMLYLGYAYRSGIGCQKDMVEAERWYKLAADAGLIRAYHALGTLYLNQKRMSEARDPLAVAAAAGFGPALDRLGRMYATGHGVERDLKKSTQYLERASDLGHVYGRMGLASLVFRLEPGIRGRLKAAALTISAYLRLVWVLVSEGYSSDSLR